MLRLATKFIQFYCFECSGKQLVKHENTPKITLCENLYNNSPKSFGTAWVFFSKSQKVSENGEKVLLIQIPEKHFFDMFSENSQ